MREIPIHHDPNIDSLTVAVNYVCNSRCSFCFIERELGLKLPDTSWDFLRAIFQKHVVEGSPYHRLILSGAEATLRRDLPDIAREALSAGGFDVVQIQTNGRMLRHQALLDRLIQAGITEYFVSIHAGTPALDAQLTRSKSSFAEMRAGLQNLRASGARLISNTVITAQSYPHLEQTARFLVEEQIPECQLWAFIEFGHIGQQAEYVSYADSAPYLRRAIQILKDAGRKVVVSWYPECLLGEHADVLDNHRATLIIDDEFSGRAQRHGGFQCPHSASCPRFGQSCQGLHERYVEEVSDHADLLRPLPPRIAAK
ncbi:MAG: radical SAM protein [Myxococcota bacterium]